MKDMKSPSIEDLPDPIIEYILSYLSPYRDLKQCMLVNKAWYRYVHDVIRKIQRDFYQSVCNMSVQWCHMVADLGLSISKRFSHSACCSENSMYIFGGCTHSNTTFNDLWRLDLGTRSWIRPLATGTYPPPKACATLVSYDENLILFGGWTHTAPYSLHPMWRIFNHIHVYNTRMNRWSQVACSTDGVAMASMAGHSATIHGDKMVVFGGIQYCEGPYQCSNNVWTLDLKHYKWQKKEISGVMPPPRYGQSQIAIDKDHILIIGGCGGPNMLYSDVWLLKMSEDDATTWEWQEMDIRSKENGAPHLAFHPACKVGSQVVVLSKVQKSRTSPSSLPVLLRAPSRIWVPPRMSALDCGSSRSEKQPDSDPCVNGKRGVLKRASERRPLSSSDEEDTQQQTAKRKPPEQDKAVVPAEVAVATTSSAGSSSSSQPSSSSASSLPSPPESKSSPDGGGAEPGQGPSRERARVGLPTGLNPHARRNRQRQLEGLDRMEQRLRDLRAGSGSYPPPSKSLNQSSSNPKTPMCLYILDIGSATEGGRVTWRAPKTHSPSAPEEIIMYSLVLGKGELIMFGGIQKDLNSRQQEGETVPEVVSNSLHFMTARKFIV